MAVWLLLVVAIFFVAGEASAATYFSRQAGNWNVNTTWSTAACGGAAAVGTPGVADAVQICNLGAAHTVTVTANATAASIAINSGNQNSTLAIDPGVTLNITGNATATGNTNLINKLFSVGAGATFAVGGNLVLVTGAGTRNAELRLADGAATTVTVGGFFAGTAAGGAFNARALITFLGQGTLNIAGNLASGATLAGGTGTINFNGGAAQTIGLYTTYNNVRISKTGGSALFSTGTTTIGGTLNVTTGTLDIRGVTLNVNGATTIDSTVSFTTSATGAKTFGGAVTVNGTWSNSINEDIVLGAGLTNSGTFGAGNGAYTLTGDFSNSNTFNAGTGNFSLTGNFTNNGTFNSSTGTFTFNGGAAQTVTGTASGTTTFANLTLSNANGLSLTGTHNVTVSTLLTLTTGAITTGANVLFISNGSNIASAGGTDFVIGNLQKAVATGAPTSVFEIGTGTSYTPVTLVFASVTTAGNITATSTATDHPDVANSGLDNTLSVNRYWTLTNSGVVFTTYTATFTFVAGDVDGGADSSIFEVSRFSPPYPAAGTWNTATVGTRTATTTQITGVSSFGDFAIGQPLAAVPGIGRFNAYDTTTAAGAVTGNIMTKVAGVTFSVDIIAIAANRKSINAGFTGFVTVELLDASDNISGTLDTSTGCRTSWTVIQTIAPNPEFLAGDNGRKTISVTENNAWKQARFRIVDVATGKLIGCSTDAFAIRPQTLTISAHDATWETAGTTRTLANTSASGGNVHKASTSAAATPRPFTLRVTPVPASATNYDGSPTTESTYPTCGTLCSSVGSLTFTGGSWTSAGSGVRENATANYSEAGTFNLRLEDTSFSVIDALDGTPDSCSNSSPFGRRACATATVEIGRFVPDRFEFASPSTPVFLTFGTALCGTRSFTYIGQPFWFGTFPSATLNAVNAAGAVTTNYPLSTAASRPVVSETYADSTAPPTAPLDTTLVGTPGAISGAGTGTYSAAAGGSLSYTRNTLATSPVGPFNAAISLTVAASDSTESAVLGNGTISATSLVFNGSGSGISFDGSDFNTGAGYTGGKTLVYGRLRMGNASGSQLVPLTVQMETQYYSGAPANAFVTNSADSCTSIASANVAMGSYTSNLTDTPNCETAVSGGGTFSSGRKTLLLAAPGSGNNGSVTLTANVDSSASGNTCASVGLPPAAATTANRPYLRGNWTTTTFTQNPSGRATFGVYRGSEEVIDIRENF